MFLSDDTAVSKTNLARPPSSPARERGVGRAKSAVLSGSPLPTS